MKVKVYYNIHKKVFSVIPMQGPGKGRVAGYTDNIDLTDAVFKVNKSGRDKVLKEKRKNVHAFIVGKMANLNCNKKINGELASYNPYKFDYFYLRKNNSAINQSEFVSLRINNKNPSIFVPQ